MKRLIYVTDQPWSASDAPAIHVARVCSGLTALGWAVELIRPSSPSPAAPESYAAISVRVPRFLRTVTFQLAATPVLIRAVFRNPGAVLYLRQSTCLVLPAIVAAVLGVPVVLEVNGHLLLEAWQRGSKLDRLLSSTGVLRLIEAVNVRVAREVVVVAPGIAKYLASRYPGLSSHISVVPNGVDGPVRPASTVAPSDRFTVGYVGALEAWQGLDYLIEAAGLLLDAGQSHLRFVLLGDGKERPSLLAQARDLGLRDSIEFVGAVPHDKVPGYIAQMDLCINYPVRARGGMASPMKIYEYLAACRPVLSADVAGLPEEFGAAIAYVDAEDSAALAAELRRLSTDRTALASLQRAAELAAGRIRSWSDVAGDVSVICERVSERRAGRTPDRPVVRTPER